MSDHPPGYRFYPTEEELVGFYLQNKLQNKREEEMQRLIPVTEFFSMDPWQLPNLARVPMAQNGEQWFFFCPRQEKEAQGGRPSRTTPSGYWKATGSTTIVYSSESRALGEKKSMVFYRGRAPTGTKTVWKLNEYKAFHQEDNPKVRSEFSLCRLYNNSSGLRHFDRRPKINTTINHENQNLSNQNPTNDVGASSSKRPRSNDSSSSDGGDLIRPENQRLIGDLRVDDYESDWDFLDLL